MIRQIALALAILVSIGGGSAMAQNNRGQGDSFTLGDYGAKAKRDAPKPSSIDQDPSLIRRQADRWPWLEPGTVVCRSEEELQRYHAAVTARLNGETAPPRSVSVAD